MTTRHSSNRLLPITTHVKLNDTRQRTTRWAGVLRRLAVAALAVSAFSAGALVGWVPANSAAPQVEPYRVSLAASSIDLQPAGRCAFGRNPDGSCRGHKVSDGAKNAYKRCLKYGKNGFNSRTNEEIGERTMGTTGKIAGEVAGGAGGKASKGAKALKNAKKGKKGKDGSNSEDSIVDGGDVGEAIGKKAGRYIGKGAGAISGCAIYLNGE